MDSSVLERIGRELALRKRLQAALLVFSRGVSARLALGGGLEALVEEVNTIFGARRTSVWLHDRRAKLLTLAASSDPRETPDPERIPTTDDGPIPTGLRQLGPLVVGTGPDRAVIAPLRGWRRALGTLVVEGEAHELNDELVVELSMDLARQLSTAIESVIVLEELIGQQRILAQAEKLASLGQFIAGIAHEMNNPLQSVLGHLELIIERGGKDLAQRGELRRIYHDADRAAKVVRNLLVFAGNQRAVRRRLNVGRLLSRAIAARRSAFQRPDVEIVREGPNDLEISGDSGLLQQALLNVLINAEQAIAQTKRAGRIVVRTSSSDGRVMITIEDTGPGITPEVLPRIFDPFFTTKEVGQGTGLGLAIVYGVIQEHGGSIHAGSSPLGGAMFTVQLPAAE